MSHTFKITDLGLQVDKVMIRPGSTLVLSSPPPAHWMRFGEVEQDRPLTVATPKAAAEAPKPRRGRPPKRAAE